MATNEAVNRMVNTCNESISMPFKSTQDFNKFLRELEKELNIGGIEGTKNMVDFRAGGSFISLDVSTFIAAHYGSRGLNSSKVEGKNEEIHSIVFLFDGKDGGVKSAKIAIVGGQRAIYVADKINKEVISARMRDSWGKTDSFMKSYLQDNVHEFSINLRFFAKHLTGIVANVRR